eukprot:CFRG0290T1
MSASNKAFSRLLSSDDSLVYRVGLHNVHKLVTSKHTTADDRANATGLLWMYLKSGNNDVARTCATELCALVRAASLNAQATINQMQSLMPSIPPCNVIVVANAIVTILMDNLADMDKHGLNMNTDTKTKQDNPVRINLSATHHPLVKLLLSFASSWPDVLNNVEQRLMSVLTTSQRIDEHGSHNHPPRVDMMTRMLHGLKPFFVHALLQPYGVEPGLRFGALSLLVRLSELMESTRDFDVNVVMWPLNILLEVLLTTSLDNSESIGWINLTLSIIVPSFSSRKIALLNNQIPRWISTCLSLCIELHSVGRDAAHILPHIRTLLHILIKNKLCIREDSVVGLGYLLLTATCDDLSLVLSLTKDVLSSMSESPSECACVHAYNNMSLSLDANQRKQADGRGWSHSYLLYPLIVLTNCPMDAIAKNAKALVESIMDKNMSAGIFKPISTVSYSAHSYSKLSHNHETFEGHAFFRTIVATARIAARSYLVQQNFVTDRTNKLTCPHGHGVFTPLHKPESSTNVATYRFYAMCSSLSSPYVHIREKAIEVMCMIVQADAKYALWALALFMFRVRNETDPMVKLRLLYRLPSLGCDKRKVTAVLQVISSMVPSSLINGYARLRLTCELWKYQPRTYTQLKDNMRLFRQTTLLNRRQKEPISEETWIAWALTVKDVCQWRGSQYGEDMLFFAIELVQKSPYDSCVVLSLQALRELCCDDVVTVRAVCRVLSSCQSQNELGLATAHLACINNETRPQVLAAYLELLAVVPEEVDYRNYDNTPSSQSERASQEEFRYRVIQLLWTAATLHSDCRVRKSACDGLLHFPLIDMISDYDAMVEDIIYQHRQAGSKKNNADTAAMGISNSSIDAHGTPFNVGVGSTERINSSTYQPIPVSGAMYTDLLIKSNGDDAESARAVVKRALDYELSFAHIRKGLDFKNKNRSGPNTENESRNEEYIVKFLVNSHKSSATPRTRYAASFGLLRCMSKQYGISTPLNGRGGASVSVGDINYELKRNVVKAKLMEFIGGIKYKGSSEWELHLHTATAWLRFMSFYLHVTCNAISAEKKRLIVHDYSSTSVDMSANEGGNESAIKTNLNIGKHKSVRDDEWEEDGSIEEEAIITITEELAMVSRASTTSRINCTLAVGALAACQRETSRMANAYVDRVVATMLCLLDLSTSGNTEVQEQNIAISGPKLAWIVTSGGVNNISPSRRVAAVLVLGLIGPRLRLSSNQLCGRDISTKLIDVFTNRQDLLTLEPTIGYVAAASLGAMVSNLPDNSDNNKLGCEVASAFLKCISKHSGYGCDINTTQYNTHRFVCLGASVGLALCVNTLTHSAKGVSEAMSIYKQLNEMYSNRKEIEWITIPLAAYTVAGLLHGEISKEQVDETLKCFNDRFAEKDIRSKEVGYALGGLLHGCLMLGYSFPSVNTDELVAQCISDICDPNLSVESKMAACVCICAVHGVYVDTRSCVGGIQILDVANSKANTVPRTKHLSSFMKVLPTLEALVNSAEDSCLSCYAGVSLGAISVSRSGEARQAPQSYSYMNKESVLRNVYDVTVDASKRLEHGINNVIHLLSEVEVLPPIDLTPVIHFVLGSMDHSKIHADAVRLLLNQVSRSTANTDMALSLVEQEIFMSLNMSSKIAVCENIHKILSTVSMESERSSTTKFVAMVLDLNEISVLRALLVGIVISIRTHRVNSHWNDLVGRIVVYLHKHTHVDMWAKPEYHELLLALCDCLVDSYCPSTLTSLAYSTGAEITIAVLIQCQIGMNEKRADLFQCQINCCTLLQQIDEDIQLSRALSLDLALYVASSINKTNPGIEFKGRLVINTLDNIHKAVKLGGLSDSRSFVAAETGIALLSALCVRWASPDAEKIHNMIGVPTNEGRDVSCFVAGAHRHYSDICSLLPHALTSLMQNEEWKPKFNSISVRVVSLLDGPTISPLGEYVKNMFFPVLLQLRMHAPELSKTLYI